jgi:alpha-tubulin suppressor-like RCC1 family protein
MTNQMILRLLFIALLACALPQQNWAQRKRDKKQEAAQQTPESAAKKEYADRERKLEEYHNSKNHHQTIQDEATRKRMKKNLKKAEKHSWGKGAPWYKRWFKRKRIKS